METGSYSCTMHLTLLLAVIHFVDLFDPNSLRPTAEGLGPISVHDGRKLFSPTLLSVVEGRLFSPYIYVGRAAPYAIPCKPAPRNLHMVREY
jgi:hypothetical protein